MRHLGIVLTWAADVLYNLRLWGAGDLLNGWAAGVLEC